MHLRKRYVIAVLTLGIHTTPRAQEMPRGVGAREVALYAQLLAMTDTRRLDTALIDRALASTWSPMRSAATLAIGQVGAEPSGVVDAATGDHQAHERHRTVPPGRRRAVPGCGGKW